MPNQQAGNNMSNQQIGDNMPNQQAGSNMPNQQAGNNMAPNYDNQPLQTGEPKLLQQPTRTAAIQDLSTRLTVA